MESSQVIPHEFNSSAVDKNREMFFNILLIFGMIGSGGLPLINLVIHEKNYSAYVDILAFVIFLGTYILFKQVTLRKLCYWIISVLSYVSVLLINFQTKDFFNVRNVSLFIVFPMIVFFLLGKKTGLMFSLGFLFTAFIGMLFSSDFNTSFQVSFDIAIAIFVLFFYQQAQEKTQQQLAQTIQEITQQKEQVQRMNALMVNRELTMIELKNKLSKLEAKPL